MKLRYISYLGLLVSLLSPVSSLAGSKIMIFGGDNHDVYLGCLNCSEYALDSVHNSLSSHGSDLQYESIFNSLGPYGSDLSTYSPCNNMAMSPPVIVNEDGDFYGYLTINDYHPKAVTDSKILRWLKYKVCK